jgi:ATP-dependent protease ClpP protease subunit
LKGRTLELFEKTDDPAIVELRIVSTAVVQAPDCGEKGAFELNGPPEKTFPRFTAALESLPARVREIHVIINAGGGHFNVGIFVYNALRRWRGRVVTEIQPVAWSGAAIVAQAGGVRRMAENSILGPHGGRLTIDLSNVPGGVFVGTPGSLRQYAAIVDEMNQVIVELFAERTGRSQSEIRALLDRDECLNAKEALAWNLVDEIGPPCDRVHDWSRYESCWQDKANAALERLRAQETEAYINAVIAAERPDGMPPWQREDLKRLREMVAARGER